MSKNTQWEMPPEQIASVFQEIRRSHPLIHMIPNMASAALCADGLSALGARPLMAVAPQEMAEVTTQADASVINLGQLNQEKITAVRHVLFEVTEKRKPLVLDPVGCGASKFRLLTVQEFLRMPWQGIVKGNHSEIYSIQQNLLTREGIDSIKDWELPEKIPSGRVYLVTGETDVILWKDKRKQVFRKTCHPISEGFSRNIVDKRKECGQNGKMNRYNIVGSGCLAGAVAGACYSVICRHGISGFREAPVGENREKVLEKIRISAATAASYGMAFALEQTEHVPGYGTAKSSLLDGLSLLAEEGFREWLEHRAASDEKEEGI